MTEDEKKRTWRQMYQYGLAGVSDQDADEAITWAINEIGRHLYGDRDLTNIWVEGGDNND